MPQHIDRYREYTAELLADSGSTPASTPVARTGLQRWRSPQVALASLGFLVFGNIGIAAVSDGAVPGDLLYPVDRAYESAAGLVGIELGGAPERLDEAAVLIDRNEYERAIEPIAAAAAEIDESASATIRSLAARFGNDSGSGDLREATLALHATVQAMIEGEPTTDLDDWKQAIDDRIEDLAGADQDQPTDSTSDEFVPPGQDNDFVPPGQADDFVPPGNDDEFVPPGQEGKDKTPPGKDDGFTPPGHDRKNSNNRGRNN